MLRELISDIRYRLRTVFQRRAVERELDDELRFHLEHEAEKHRRAGAEPAEARRLAAVTFGGLGRITEDTRDAHGTALFDQLVQDVRYALRGLRARPFFTAVIIATLGLGVGANTAMFGIIDRTMLRPPLFLRDPASVNRVFVTWSTADGKRDPQRKLEYRSYTDLVQWTRATSELAGFAFFQIAVGDGDATRELEIEVVTASYFNFFNAKPVIGRFFTAAEDQPPVGEPVVVLAYGYWQSQYGGRGDVLGSHMKIGRTAYRIVGVAPRGFLGVVHRQQAPAAFIPATSYAAGSYTGFYKDYSWSWMDVLIRRKAGVTPAQASADLTNAYLLSWNARRELDARLPDPNVVHPAASAAPVLLARGPFASPEAKVMLWVGGVSAIVLVIVCANVANLLLARALRRRREIAVRRALGGSRGRIVRQLLTETLTLSLFGAVAGLAGAQLVSGALRRIFAAAADEGIGLFGDRRVFAFAIVLAVLTALLAGLVPALHSGRDDLAGALRGGMRDGSSTGTRSRRALLVFQTALSVLLLVGAGLFVRSVHALRAMRIGYDVDQIILIGANMRGVHLERADAAALSDRLVERGRSIPGVERASLTVSVPFWSSGARRVFVPGLDSAQVIGRFAMHAGSTDYFATIGTRILRGRGFSPTDRADAPYIAVVSESMARALWKTENPIGKCFRVGSDTMPCTTIVGVAENIRAQKITNESEFAYYLPIEQYRAQFGVHVPYVYVRVKGRAVDYAETVRAQLQAEMPGTSYVNAEPFRGIVDATMRSWMSGATMFSTLGGLALVLAAIGLYAVVAFGVAQRVNEIGVRIALGAMPRDVVRLVVGEGLGVTMIGVALGTAAALFAGRTIEPLLYGVTARDPWVFVVVAVMLAAVGVLASLVPAARAARVDPNVALRAD